MVATMPQMMSSSSAVTKGRYMAAAPTKPKLGSGERFAALKSQLSDRKGVSNPGALSAFVGNKKFGQKKMESMAQAGKKK